jgi:hypothetical protein
MQTSGAPNTMSRFGTNNYQQNFLANRTSMVTNGFAAKGGPGSIITMSESGGT